MVIDQKRKYFNNKTLICKINELVNENILLMNVKFEHFKF